MGSKFFLAKFHNSNLPSLQTEAKAVEQKGFHYTSTTSSIKSKFLSESKNFSFFIFQILQVQSADADKKISESKGLHLT